MGTSNSGMLRILADARAAESDNAVTLEALQEILLRITDLQDAAKDQQANVGEIQAALISMQGTLSGIVSAQAAQASKLNAVIATLGILPAMQTQLQAIHDVVIQTP